jgi:hypothetical protein
MSLAGSWEATRLGVEVSMVAMLDLVRKTRSSSIRGEMGTEVLVTVV